MGALGAAIGTLIVIGIFLWAARKVISGIKSIAAEFKKEK